MNVEMLHISTLAFRGKTWFSPECPKGMRSRQGTSEAAWLRSGLSTPHCGGRLGHLAAGCFYIFNVKTLHACTAGICLRSWRNHVKGHLLRKRVFLKGVLQGLGLHGAFELRSRPHDQCDDVLPLMDFFLSPGALCSSRYRMSTQASRICPSIAWRASSGRRLAMAS